LQEVPAGEFIFGSDPSDKDVCADEKTTGVVKLSQNILRDAIQSPMQNINSLWMRADMGVAQKSGWVS